MVRMIADDDDNDSLFGSPPPSPTWKGRSPLPALALPSASHQGLGRTALQNVGTIALPGSHPYSELPVNPIASSSSLRHIGQLAGPSTASPSAPQAGPLSCPSPAPCVSPVSHASKSKVNGKVRSEEVSAPPSDPEMILPDPSKPPPAHFLRNQTALLGKAGLISGIKPAKLSVKRLSPGKSPSNPIVVDAEDEVVTLGRKKRFRPTSGESIDPSLLPAPSIQDIVPVLIGQKDIFPVLENLRKLIASQHQKEATEERSVSPNPHPRKDKFGDNGSSTGLKTKKRKLHSVPAGAVDWDVPYPFAAGEGPDSYRTTWERERGKRLISQLASLIKTAARKAAMKNYYMNEMRQKVLEKQWQSKLEAWKERVNQNTDGPCRSAAYGLDDHAAKEAQRKAVLDSSTGQGSVNCDRQQATTTVAQSVQLRQQPKTFTAFDHLISSILAASTEQHVISSPTPSIGPHTSNDNTSFLPGSGTNVEAGTIADIGKGPNLFDSYMSVLQNVLVPPEGFAQQDTATAINNHDCSATVTPGSSTDDFGYFDDLPPVDFYLNEDMNFDFDGLDGSTTTPTDSMMYPHSEMSPAVMPSPVPMFSPPTSENECIIDPQLSALSNIGPQQEPSLPSSAPSPIPSVGAAGPPTPSSVTWDLNVPDISFAAALEGVPGYVPSLDLHGPSGDDGSFRRGIFAEASWADMPLMQWKGKDKVASSPGMSNCGEPLKKFNENLMLGPSGTSTPPMDTAGDARWRVGDIEANDASMPSRCTGSDGTDESNPLNAIKSHRQLVVQKARERRQQLAEELVQVKIKLWEATVEGGVVANIVDQLDSEM